MKNSKLVEVLASFTEKEITRLGDFLCSPYFQKLSTHKDQVYSLYTILVREHPNFPPAKIEKEKIHFELFNQPYNTSGRLNKLMSYLFKQVEEFIFSEVRLQDKQGFSRQQSLANYYLGKKLKLPHSNALKKQIKIQKNLSPKSTQDLYHDYLTEAMVSNWQSYSNSRQTDVNLPDTIKALDIYFFTARLEHTCNLLAQEKFHNLISNSNSYAILDQLKSLLTEKHILAVPQISIYSAVYEILKSDEKNVALNLENIKNLERLLKKHKHSIQEHQLKNLHGFNRSILMRVLNLGKMEYTAAAFEMYKSHLKSKVILNNNTLHQGNYKNIAAIGIMLGKYEWVKRFLNEYKLKVYGKDEIEEVYLYNLSNLYFHQGEIEESHKLLPQHFDDLYYKLAAKRLEIKILYTNDIELLEFKINAFNQYIYRLSNKLLPEVARLGNKNFAKILLRILAPNNRSASKKDKLKEMIMNKEAIKEKDWLHSILNK